MQYYSNVHVLLKVVSNAAAVLCGLLFLSTTVLADVSLNKNGVALYGYDPVSFHDGTPIIGKPDIYFDNDDARYLFLNQKNKNKFSNNVQRYQPQYGGFCAYGVSMGKKLDVELLSTGPQYEVVNGKLYLLLNRATHEMWKTNTLKNISTSDKLWPAL